ncbi:uncharacterized protein [Diadema antillarum]|uniref:uncharacterized protein n=1 Tax=Diadema antillarum TaxID=105358 RepID=UPI003A8BBD90
MGTIPLPLNRTYLLDLLAIVSRTCGFDEIWLDCTCCWQANQTSWSWEDRKDIGDWMCSTADPNKRHLLTSLYGEELPNFLLDPGVRVLAVKTAPSGEDVEFIDSHGQQLRGFIWRHPTRLTPTSYLAYEVDIGRDFQESYGPRVTQPMSSTPGNKELQTLRYQFEQTESRVMDLENEIKTKATIISSMQKEQECNKDEITNLQRTLNDAEQYSRRNCLWLYGIPESDHEDTDEVMLDLASKELNVKLKPEDIDRSHRICPPRPVKRGEKTKPPRPIIVKFATYRVRHLVIRNRKRLKGKHIGIEEDLTATNRNLLQKANELVKTNSNVIAAWSTDGRILVLLKATNRGTVKKRIHSVTDLQRL